MLSFAQLSYSAIDVLSLAIVIAGILVQARVGIGFALLSAPALFIINENYMPGPILILGFLLSLLMYLNEQRPLEIKTVLPAILARIPGSWCGVLTLAYLPQWLLGVIIGISLLAASLVSSVHASIKLTRSNLAIAGFLSGFSGTITSIGGPIMALLYQAQTPAVTRNALLCFFLVGTPISILLLMLADGMNQEAYVLCMKMLPGVIIGFILSKFKPLAFIAPSKKIIIALSLFSAFVILSKSLSMIL
ncbi:TSUP family transporter [Marinomonas sp. 15G1-11]|uniref:Probable membrane transporter protein n=1 Tax=Marinomonas phaeophyticola TaxID=3004091 RepID=A0ABT4JX90_9GAMM|nr:TSUP family transporter [Marinomonas sp. 15G1-11]MCZ2722990.1 TSUP family transporter [Marinomonas sp. 15G1-11]